MGYYGEEWFVVKELEKEIMEVLGCQYSDRGFIYLDMNWSLYPTMGGQICLHSNFNGTCLIDYHNQNIIETAINHIKEKSGTNRS